MPLRRTGVLAAPVLLLLVLSVPIPEPAVAPAPPGGEPFAWNRDSVWQALETSFRVERMSGCAALDSTIRNRLAEIDRLTGALEGGGPVGPKAPILDSLETAWFAAGTGVAACPEHLESYAEAYRRARSAVKEQSRLWDMGDRATRDRLYRALYGGRAALEEAMLQHLEPALALLPGSTAPSATPSAVVAGVTIHSGDMLVSRGGAPTSALIARGSDYPGNFSHVALVHVDETSGAASTIEAHIENGVSVATAAKYLGDKKLRIMVLRPRADLPQIVADPLLPHRAATAALERARSGHVPYDFLMDYQDPSRLFCSEVASSAYRDLGVTLWTGLSTISSEGLRRWLWGFGVRHFETQEPSDLEYDPQLVVVAEWRDPATLRQDRIDNAVIDAMLEGADRGDALSFAWYRLPLARLVKAWSWTMVRLGRTGPIPEGMSASAALRSQAYSARHRRLAAQVGAEAEAFAKREGYAAPYWRLLALARTAVEGESARR